MRTWVAVLILMPILAGCAAVGPLAEETASREPSPAAVAESASVPDGREMLWGGRIVGVSNEAETTRLEVLAYPLERDQRPDVYDRPAQGRFVVTYPGFLDPVDYAPGRVVTVRGPVVDIVHGRVGDAQYAWPQMRAEELHRWPRDPDPYRNPPRFEVRAGILFSN